MSIYDQMSGPGPFGSVDDWAGVLTLGEDRHWYGTGAEVLRAYRIQTREVAKRLGWKKREPWLETARVRAVRRSHQRLSRLLQSVLDQLREESLIFVGRVNSAAHYADPELRRNWRTVPVSDPPLAEVLANWTVSQWREGAHEVDVHAFLVDLEKHCIKRGARADAAVEKEYQHDRARAHLC